LTLTVTVACKIANGIRIGDGTVILGFGPLTADRRFDLLVGGYALTRDVDADAWAKWEKANADSDMVKRQMVFADADVGALRSKCHRLGGVQGSGRQASRTG
jgi:hypothetical protein